MKNRNFYILIGSIILGIAVFWLTVYAVITLDVNLFQSDKIIIIKGEGISNEYTISLDELKSDKYIQVVDKEFKLVNSGEYEYHIIYSGTSLWSILEVENLLIQSPEELNFQFWGRDAYHSPKPINLSIAQNNPNLVILAYEENGHPLFETGPIRSVIDDTIIPLGEYSFQYSVQKLATIIIE
jgi:hypothetical protein